MSEQRSHLYAGSVMHVRLRPRQHRLRYRLFQLLLPHKCRLQERVGRRTHNLCHQLRSRGRAPRRSVSLSMEW